TVTPGTGLPNASVTFATSRPTNPVVTVAVCPEPASAATAAAAPGVLVRLNDAWPAAPAAAAVTRYAPAAVFAATATPACPAASVVAVAPAGNVAPGPVAGPANVTATPGTGLPNVSVT